MHTSVLLGLLITACDVPMTAPSIYGEGGSLITGTETEADTDTDTDTDTDVTLRYQGDATVVEGTSGSYSGSEQALFTADGDGTVLCQVQYVLNSSSIRTDCTDCLWAFVLVAEAVEVKESSGCMALGLDPAMLNGQERVYGLHGDGDRLLVDPGTGWEEGGAATYDPVKGNFSYELILSSTID